MLFSLYREEYIGKKNNNNRKKPILWLFFYHEMFEVFTES